MINRRLIRNFDFYLLLAVIALCVIGTLTLYSATRGMEGLPDPFYFVKRQLLFMGVGTALMLLVCFIDYVNFSNWTGYLYAVNLLLLILVLVIGEVEKGAMRRIQIGFFDLQPSEIAKVIIIITLARLLADKEGKLPYFQDLLPALAATALPMALIFLQPDLGTSLVFLTVLVGMLYAVSYTHLDVYKRQGYDDETISYLSDILQIEQKEIEEAIKGRLYMRYLPLRLKSDITMETIAQISEQRWKLKGVNIEIRPIREYRTGSTAAHILGFLGEGPVDELTRKRWSGEGYNYKEGDYVGQEGVERTWEPHLRGIDGEQLIETNNMGQPINYLAVSYTHLGGIVTSKSIRVGGDDMDEAIIQYIKKKYNLMIGDRTAEEVKIRIGTAFHKDTDSEMEVRGRDLVTGLPKTLKITSEEVKEALGDSLEVILEAIRVTLEKTPPELAADVMDKGIVLTGGGALLHGFDRRTSEERCV